MDESDEADNYMHNQSDATQSHRYKSRPIHQIRNFLDEEDETTGKVKIPKEVFLDHIREYSKRFITQQRIVIDKYHFCRQDILNDIF